MYQGRIVCANVVTRDGNRKPRPVIVISKTAENLRTGVFACVALSNSSFYEQPRPDHYVVIPSHPAGAVTTKLRKETVALCDHLYPDLSIDDVITDIGYAKSPVVEQVVEAVTAFFDSKTD
jgi:mRNA-degrading endonuclease toxin of MazEF toxin-antitoxin module